MLNLGASKPRVKGGPGPPPGSAPEYSTDGLKLKNTTFEPHPMRFSAILSREFCRIQFQRTINGFSVFRFHVFKSFLPIFDKDYEIDLF